MKAEMPRGGLCEDFAGPSLREPFPVTLREYQPQDAPAVLKLFSDVFKENPGPDFWDWKYPGGGAAKMIAHVAETDRGEIAGFYGGLIRFFQYRGREILASQAADVMLRNDFRGSGLFQRLGEAHFRELQKAGVKIIYGFPTREHFIAGSRKLEYECMKEIPVWERRVTMKDIPVLLKRPSGEFRISRLRRFDARADALWERVRTAYTSSPGRGSHYLNWRYPDQPGSNFELFLAEDAVSRIPRGILVTGNSLKGKGTGSLILWEIFTAPEDSAAIQSLFERALSLAVMKRRSHLMLWSEGGASKENVWRRLGFSRRQREETVFAFKALHESVDEKVLKENFYYTLGDSDFPA